MTSASVNIMELSITGHVQGVASGFGLLLFLQDCGIYKICMAAGTNQKRKRKHLASTRKEQPIGSFHGSSEWEGQRDISESTGIRTFRASEKHKDLLSRSPQIDVATTVVGLRRCRKLLTSAAKRAGVLMERPSACGGVQSLAYVSGCTGICLKLGHHA